MEVKLKGNDTQMIFGACLKDNRKFVDILILFNLTFHGPIYVWQNKQQSERKNLKNCHPCQWQH